VRDKLAQSGLLHVGGRHQAFVRQERLMTAVVFMPDMNYLYVMKTLAF
jgi:predicted transcriptional regulator